jgi:hypothetical protein
VPTIGKLVHLSLPPNQLGQATLQFTGGPIFFDVAYYAGGIVARPQGWKNFTIKAADASKLPVLYTPAFLVACPTPRGTNQVLRTPPIPFGKKNTLLRLPRVVVFPTYPDGSVPGDPVAPDEAAQWAAGNASWLDANNIAVVTCGSPSGTTWQALRIGLPLSGVTQDSSTVGEIWDWQIDPSTFVAGLCFEFHEIHGDYTVTSPTQFITTVAQNDVQNNIKAYPRFAKRQVAIAAYGIPVVGTFNYMAGLCQQLAPYGYTQPVDLTSPFGDSAGPRLGFYNSNTAAVKAFFGVSP